MKKYDLDTPCLLIDSDIVLDNIGYIQAYANKNNVTLRPHTKTHKMPYFAKLQEEKGAKGIAVAKVSEAEVMAENGLNDIFIANEVVGEYKLNKIKSLSEKINISFGIDSIEQTKMVEKVFENSPKKAQVLIEIEVGENRSGIIEKQDFIDLVNYIKTCKNVYLKGIFSHDGHSYKAKDKNECLEIFNAAQKRTLEFSDIARKLDYPLEVVSIGSTPSSMFDFQIMKGVTELRIGTYIFMDASQGNAIGSHKRCAATVLTTVISKPTSERVITDVGAKGITMQSRSVGICKTNGVGTIKNFNNVYIDSVFDEHAIIYNKDFRNAVNIGDKVEIIPNHICPVCNLYNSAYLIKEDEVVKEIPILCRGKQQ